MIHLFHKWKITAAQPMKRRALIPLTCEVIDPEGPPEDITQVLFTCKTCGGLKTQTLNGIWTMNDLMGGSDGKA